LSGAQICGVGFHVASKKIEGVIGGKVRGDNNLFEGRTHAFFDPGGLEQSVELCVKCVAGKEKDQQDNIGNRVEGVCETLSA